MFSNLSRYVVHLFRGFFFTELFFFSKVVINDPLYGTQWHLKNHIGSGEGISLVILEE
jgi:hypothetical protein